jgi:Mg2+ and Co2+ transporter CorA
MLNAFERFGDGQVVHATEPDKIAAAYHDLSAQFWLDIAAPDDSEHALLSDVFGFQPLVIEAVGKRGSPEDCNPMTRR